MGDLDLQLPEILGGSIQKSLAGSFSHLISWWKYICSTNFVPINISPAEIHANSVNKQIKVKVNTLGLLCLWQCFQKSQTWKLSKISMKGAKRQFQPIFFAEFWEYKNGLIYFIPLKVTFMLRILATPSSIHLLWSNHSLQTINH